jgi:hypothetical protein
MDIVRGKDKDCRKMAVYILPRLTLDIQIKLMDTA